MIERPSSTGRIPPDRWVIALCFAAITFDGYDLIVYGSVVPALLQAPDWSLTPQQVGDIGSSALLGMFAGALAVGTLTDIAGRRRVFIGCLTWFSVAMLLVAAAPTPTWLGIFRFLAGLGFGGVVPTAIALTTEWAPPGRRNFCNALMLAGFPFGGIAAAAAAIALLDDHGFRLLFAFGGLPLVTVVPLAIWRLPESPSFTRSVRPRPAKASSDGRRLGLVSLLGRKTLLTAAVFAAANFCGMMLVYGLNTWLPQIMRSAGYPLGSALSFLVVLNVGGIIGGLLGSSIADRVGSRSVTTLAFGGSALCIALLALPLPAGALYLLVALVGAAGVGTQIVLFGYVATHFADDIRASALGFTSGVGRLGAVCGPWVGGQLASRDVSFESNFFVFAAIALAGALLTRAIPPSRRPIHADSAAGVAVGPV